MEKARIMVVEDEFIVAKDLQNSLRTIGYSVPAIASSGEEALKLMAKFYPNLVLMDIVLKGDIDGIETAEEIRERYNIPILYLTAYTDDKTLERAKITQPFGYIVKPFEIREVHSNIEMALYRHRLRRSSNEKKKDHVKILNSVGNALITTNNTGSITFMNHHSELLTGWEIANAMGKKITTVFKVKTEASGKYLTDAIKNVLNEGITIDSNRSDKLVRSDRKEIPINFSVIPLRLRPKAVGGIVVSFSEIQGGGPIPKAVPTDKAKLQFPNAKLTKREEDIARLVFRGYSNKTISKKLFITERTVKNHLTNIYSKLGINNRLQLALEFLN